MAELCQWYETTIADREGHELSFVTIPSRSMAAVAGYDAPAIQAKLDLQPLTASSPAVSLEDLLMASLLGDTAEDVSALWWESNLAVRAVTHRETWDFAEQAASAKVVPFEQSPLQANSLHSILTAAKASAAGLGVWVGLAAANSRPLVLITVPAGIILVGVSARVAEALGDGLAQKIRALMGLPEEAPQPKRNRSGTSGGSTARRGAATA